MKKNLLVFLIMLIFACLCLYADDKLGVATGSGNTGGSAYVPVNFDLSGGENGETSWEIGFTKVIPETFTANSEITPLEDIPLTYGGDNGNQGVPADNVYVYWIIKGNPKLKISLSADGAMTGETDTNKINWKVSWDTDKSIGTDENYSTNTSASYSGVQVHVDEKTIDVGSKPLTIITQDISEAAADSYSGKLTLTIEPTESSVTTGETV